ncbi:hypothetical protein EV1_032703 [Malus domestica]
MPFLYPPCNPISTLSSSSQTCFVFFSTGHGKHLHHHLFSPPPFIPTPTPLPIHRSFCYCSCIFPLSSTFYHATCPQATFIIRAVVQKVFAKEH